MANPARIELTSSVLETDVLPLYEGNVVALDLIERLTFLLPQFSRLLEEPTSARAVNSGEGVAPVGDSRMRAM